MLPTFWTRIDDRLIHGQVTVGWRQHLRYQAICVVDDEAAVDAVLRDLLRLATPDGVALYVYAVQEAASTLAASRFDKTLLLLKSPQTALTLVEAGLPLSRLNVGNLAAGSGGVRVYRSVSLAPEHVAALDALAARGVEIAFQPTPDDPPVDWQVLRRRHFGRGER